MSALLYEYKATDAAGRSQSGRVEAPDRSTAIREVRAKGLTPVSVIERKVRRSLLGPRVGTAEVGQFTYEIGTLLEAAVPIGDGLRAIAEQESNPAVSRMVQRIAQRVDAGSTITDALREHERVFGSEYIETIAAAEKSGSVRRALEQLAENLEWQAETRRRVQQAVMYPLAVAVALGGGTAFLLAFVVPKFTSMFQERGVELPTLTRMLDSVGYSLNGYWWAYLGGLIASIFIVRSMWATPAGRITIDRALHRVPYIRTMLRALGVTRFSRVLGMSLSAGISLIDAVEQAGRASGRPMLASQMQQVSRRVRQGSSLTDALAGVSYLPIFAKRMLAAGEEAAELPRLCGVIARRYEREAEHLSKNLGTLIEPVLIAALTGVVLLVALGIFLPMWDMASVMR